MARLSEEDVELALDALAEGLKLQALRRFWGQVYWETETEAARTAVAAEGRLPLESVAAHSWHVADAVLVVGPLAFEGRLNLGKAVALAVMHDKLEMFIGDWDPVGDGTGKGTHAFDPARRAEKQMAEERAAEEYLSRLPAGTQGPQARLLDELAAGVTDEARAVRALDKLQALVYLTVKKAGTSTDAGLRFLLTYEAPVTRSCPEVAPFIFAAQRRLFRSVGEHRGIDGTVLYERFAFELLATQADRAA